MRFTGIKIGFCNNLLKILMGSQPFETRAERFLLDLLLLPWKFPCVFPKQKESEEMATVHQGLGALLGWVSHLQDRRMLFEEGGF